MEDWFMVRELEIDINEIDLMAFCVKTLDDLEEEASTAYREKMEIVNEKRAALEIVNEWWIDI